MPQGASPPRGSANLIWRREMGRRSRIWAALRRLPASVHRVRRSSRGRADCGGRGATPPAAWRDDAGRHGVWLRRAQTALDFSLCPHSGRRSSLGPGPVLHSDRTTVRGHGELVSPDEPQPGLAAARSSVEPRASARGWPRWAATSAVAKGHRATLLGDAATKTRSRAGRGKPAPIGRDGAAPALKAGVGGGRGSDGKRAAAVPLSMQEGSRRSSAWGRREISQGLGTCSTASGGAPRVLRARRCGCCGAASTAREEQGRRRRREASAAARCSGTAGCGVCGRLSGALAGEQARKVLLAAAAVLRHAACVRGASALRTRGRVTCAEARDEP
jgi:hypothetical protein